MSSRLTGFEWKSAELANVRCPFCGDSKKDKTKKRGYFYCKGSAFRYKCHNCGIGVGLSKFIQKLDAELYREYLFESFDAESVSGKKTSGKDKVLSEIRKMETKSLPASREAVKHLFKIVELPQNHLARQELKARKLDQFSDMFYYSENYMDWVHTFVDPEKFEKPPATDPRIVLTYKDEFGKIFGYTGRSLDPKTSKKTKYLHIRYPDCKDRQLIWGLDRVDFNKKTFILEGQFNSLFLSNAVAVSGSSLDKMFLHPNVSNFVFVWDNDPRNPDIVRQVKKAIDFGKSVVLYPSTMPQGDINDLAIDGMAPSEIEALLNNNTFSGTAALLHFNEWKKTDAPSFL